MNFRQKRVHFLLDPNRRGINLGTSFLKAAYPGYFSLLISSVNSVLPKNRRTINKGPVSDQLNHLPDAATPKK
jgi:hypothetical protein